MNNTSTPLSLAQAIAKSIALTENGGKINTKNPSAGKSGEMKSIFQYTPETWAADSEQVFGKPGAPMNTDTEAYVATHLIDKWLQKGYTPPQIFSMWNAGGGEPDAYTGKFSNGQSSTGTNKQGVPYSVKNYVDKANKYLSQIKPDVLNPSLAQGNSTSLSNQSKQVGPDQYKNAISTIVDLVKKGQKPTNQSTGLLSTQTSTPQNGLLSTQPTVPGV